MSQKEGRKWYAVQKDQKVGLFDTWEKHKTQVHEYKGSEYKRFQNSNNALSYLQ